MDFVEALVTLELYSISATEADVKKAHKRLVSRWHPDKHQGPANAAAEAKTKKFNAAKAALDRHFANPPKPEPPKPMAPDWMDLLKKSMPKAPRETRRTPTNEEVIAKCPPEYQPWVRAIFAAAKLVDVAYRK